MPAANNRAFTPATTPDTLGQDEIALHYARNPLENISRLIFEYTTLCQLNCLHCRNGHLRATLETDVVKLKRAVDVVLPLGIRRFDFVGGEVTMYGRGWLDVLQHIREHPPMIANVLTSGWFLEKTDFKAAGVRYVDDAAYLAHLKERGLTHVTFSLDGPEEMHDRWRGVPGLYRRIMHGFDSVRAAGLMPRVSVVLEDDLSDKQTACWLGELADAIYDFQPGTSLEKKLLRLTTDDINYVSHFIDVGNGVQLKRGKHRIDAFPDEQLRCKAFFRPAPNLRIKATGELSICPLLDAGEGYGNIHDKDLVHLLNHMHESFVFRLHAEHRIADNRQYLDPEVFGGHVDHVCSLRSVLTLIAREMEDRGVDPEDSEAIHEINVEVAQRSGFLPPAWKGATGQKPPT
ncbi:MAG: radical SAM protein [Pseudomonadota bacterium]|nr:radical SAM protein [Pseudomonadota bacterium]